MRRNLSFYPSKSNRLFYIMDIKVLVATHKDFFMPHDDMYLPVRVGNALAKDDFGYQGDDAGENISEKNPYFCELTAMYWGWKNVTANYIGLAHYRRHFSFKKKGTNWESVLSKVQAEFLFQHYDVVVPVKRRYWIETIASHYKHTHDIRHLEITREIIAKDHPEYLAAYDRVMKSRSAHMFNMFIMKKSLADEYCAWLFDILFKLEKRVDLKGIDPFQARLFGRVSEFLLDVWLETKGLNYKEIGYVQIGPYNFWKKVGFFLRAKLMGEKYSVSA